MSLVASALLLLAVAGMRPRQPAEDAGVAELASLTAALWPDGNVPPVAAVWTVRSRAPLCDDSPRTLRRLRALAGQDLQIVVLAVGDGTAHWLKAFLRRERLSAAIVEMAEDVFPSNSVTRCLVSYSSRKGSRSPSSAAPSQHARRGVRGDTRGPRVNAPVPAPDPDRTAPRTRGRSWRGGRRPCQHR